MSFQGPIEKFVQRVLCEYGLILRIIFSYPILLCKSSVFSKGGDICPITTNDDNICILLQVADFEKVAKIILEANEVDDAKSYLILCDNNNQYISNSSSEHYSVHLLDDISFLGPIPDDGKNFFFSIRFALVALVYLIRDDAQKNNVLSLFELKNGISLSSKPSLQQLLKVLWKHGCLVDLIHNEEEFDAFRRDTAEILSATQLYCKTVDPTISKNVSMIEYYIVERITNGLQQITEYKSVK